MPGEPIAPAAEILPAATLAAEADDALLENSAQAAIWNAKALWFAVFTVLAVAWFPYTVVNVLYWWFGDDSSNWTYVADTLWEVVQHSAIIAVIIYVMYCDGRPWSAFGVTRPRWLEDGAIALGILVVSSGVLSVSYGVAGMFVGVEALDDFSESAYEFAAPAATGDFLALVLLSLSVGLSEELVMRGYLIPTFERLLNSTPLSVLLTSLLFASYHIYQGFGSTVWIFILGLVFGAAFCWLRRIWPLVIAHAAMDVIALS
jgi:membrane protease YdiL (CAAX protease family)